jgi:hypothetical protein
MQVTLKRSERVSLFLKQVIGFVYWNIPGSLLIINGKNERYVVGRDFWVEITDGKSRDLVPLPWCAQDFIAKVEAYADQHWLLKRIKLTSQQKAYLDEKVKLEQTA